MPGEVESPSFARPFCRTWHVPNGPNPSRHGGKPFAWKRASTRRTLEQRVVSQESRAYGFRLCVGFAFMVLVRTDVCLPCTFHATTSFLSFPIRHGRSMRPYAWHLSMCPSPAVDACHRVHLPLHPYLPPLWQRDP